MSLERSLAKRTLRAVLDRLIPEDDYVGAFGVDLEDYVVVELAGDRSDDLRLMVGGLEGIERVAALRAGIPFAELSACDQDAVLGDIERGGDVSGWPEDTDPSAFFMALVELAHEGFYAGPDSGGTAAPWAMLGYTSRVPGRP